MENNSKDLKSFLAFILYALVEYKFYVKKLATANKEDKANLTLKLYQVYLISLVSYMVISAMDIDESTTLTLELIIFIVSIIDIEQ